MKRIVCSLAVVSFLWMAGISFGAERSLSGVELSTLSSEAPVAGTVDAVHELYGRYIDSINQTNFDVDVYGRISTAFQLTLINGARWAVTFPQTLRLDAFGSYTARGTVQGLWSTGVCTYPATISLTPAFNGAYDVAVLLPQNYNPNCTYTGTHQVLWSVVRY